MTQWTHKILDSKGEILFVSTVFPDGRNAYYYMLMSRANNAAFYEVLKMQKEIELTDFGRVVRSGWGEPSEEDKEFMRKNYNAEV